MALARGGRGSVGVPSAPPGTRQTASAGTCHVGSSMRALTSLSSAAESGRMVTPGPGAGQRPSMTIMPPCMPLPGSWSTSPWTTISPPRMSLPTRLPSFPRTRMRPSCMEAPRSSSHPSSITMVPPRMDQPAMWPTCPSHNNRPPCNTAPNMLPASPRWSKEPELPVEIQGPRRPSARTRAPSGRKGQSPDSPSFGTSDPSAVQPMRRMALRSMAVSNAPASCRLMPMDRSMSGVASPAMFLRRGNAT